MEWIVHGKYGDGTRVCKDSIEEHGRIMDAIAAGDGERAKKEMYAHIMRSRDDMLTYYQ